ncbi:MAG: tyrosine-type recombinase/integrase [Magnetococcus sp. YQC-5]
MKALSKPACKNIEFPQLIGASQPAVLTDTTLVAYSGDLRRYFDWGGTVPSASKTVADYLMAHAGTHKYATLVRWRVSIGKAHTSQGLDDPSKSDAVNDVLMGIRRSYGREQRKVAPLLKEQVIAIVAAMDDRLKDKRDKALILFGFAAGLRRSDVTSLLVADLFTVPGGIEIRSQEGTVVLRHASGSVCPVRAMKEWLTAAKLQEGPVFQGISRHGQRSGTPLTGHGVALIVKERVQAIGLDPTEYSGLSLRAGLVASAVAAGVPVHMVNRADGPSIL